MAPRRVAICLILLLLPAIVTPSAVAAAGPTPAATSSAAPTVLPGSAATWWQPLAFAGQPITRVVVAADGLIAVSVNGHVEVSQDAGLTWRPASALPAPMAPAVGSWTVLHGRPASITGTGPKPDSAGPALPPTGMVTGPLGWNYAVAATPQGDVWYRTQQGGWDRALVLLPPALLQAPPAITALVSFDTRVLTPAVYMGTDGYGVLVSQDGGVDWIRASPNLPSRVLGLATDSTTGVVYAATDRGLYIHHLQGPVGPPAYAQQGFWQYWGRWIGIGLITALSCIAGIVGLQRLVPWSRRGGLQSPPAQD